MCDDKGLLDKSGFAGAFRSYETDVTSNNVILNHLCVYHHPP